MVDRTISAIETALHMGDGRRAAALAEQALAHGLIHPVCLRAAAVGRAAAGRHDQAAALLGQAIDLAPGDAGLRLDLARTLAAGRRMEAALEAVEAALACAPQLAQAWETKARLLQDSGDWPAARQAFERAIVLAPTAPTAVTGLAALSLLEGDAPQARRLAARAVERGAVGGEAAFTLAKATLAEGDFAAAETDLARLAQDARTPPAARAEVLNARGDALHGLKRYSEAFEAYAEGKAILRQLYAARAAGRPGETAKAGRLRRALEAKPDAAWSMPLEGRAIEGEAAMHVFLVGFPRSGTTLLEQALAGHPNVTALEERPTLAEPIDALLTDEAAIERLAKIGEDEAADWRRRYWEAVRGFGVEPAGRTFIDKAPGETANLILMGRLFPKARFLFALRDPRDVVLSCFRRSFQMNAMTYEFTSLSGTATCYDAVMGAALAARARLPSRLIEVRHEALVEDVEGELRAVCEFLDLDWRREMADVATTATRRAIRTPSAAQVRKGVNRSGLGGWRAYTAQMYEVADTLSPWIARFGYR